jgi:hypothetical protein
VYTAFYGRTPGDEVLAAVKDFFAHHYPHEPRFAVFDFSGVLQFDVESIQVERIVMEDRRAAAMLPQLSIAVVAPEAVQDGLARWQLRLDPTPGRTVVVTSLGQALRWLGDEGIDAERAAEPPS